MIGKNNPCNVRYNNLNRWKGLVGNTRGFCDFENLYYGLRAVFYLVMVSYRKRSYLTYHNIVYRYAPPSENSSALYEKFICDKCNKFPWDIPYDDDDWIDLVYNMCIYEGNGVPRDKVVDAYFKFKKCN